MFETNDQARLQPSVYFAPEEGTHQWAYISQTANNEWFYVTYETADEEVIYRQQMMIPMAPYVLALATRDTPEAFIQGVKLVSPPWLNGSDTWLMEEIKTIGLIGAKYVYELSDGRIYPSELSDIPAKTMWPKGES
ncbi:hypothetical protein [Pseudomonas putida]|uniref:hypothetical protein n=1 Tax=Pseudomonas putida TaxID=303 RepID=UPI000D33BFC2|nr:hypothetical protein [Pseudomonas putida]PTV51799.1 hypothetical protein DBL03_25430 [Pseudomonas putida]